MISIESKDIDNANDAVSEISEHIPNKGKRKKTVLIIIAILIRIIAVGVLGFFIGRSFNGGFSISKNLGAASKEDYLKDMAAGINERIADDTDESNMSDEEKADYYKKLVNLELAKIGKYEGVSFGDEKFDALVEKYLEALNIQLLAAENYRHEYLYNGLWQGGRKARCGIITEFYENYGLDISSEDLASYKNEVTSIEYTYTISPAEDDPDFDSDSIAKKVSVKKYDYSTYYSNGSLASYNLVYVLTNKSEYDLDIKFGVQAYDKNNSIIETDDSTVYCIGPGESYPVKFSFKEKAAKYDYTISVSESNRYSLVSDMKSEVKMNTDNVVIKLTNNGEKTVGISKAFVIFMKNGKAVYSKDSIYFTDADYQLKPGKSETETVKCDEAFDDILIYYLCPSDDIK